MPIDQNLELDLLRAFIAVAETGSFTAAAPIVGRSQSAVSQKVLRIEEILGEPVFSRASRSLHITPVGEKLLAFSRDAVKQNDQFVSAIRSLHAVRALRLGIAENLVPTHLTQLLARFMSLNPECVLELTTGLSSHLLQRYSEKQLDAIIVRPRDDLPINGRVIWSEPLVWCCGNDYEPAAADPVRLIMLKPPCGYRALMIDALNARRRAWVTACVANSLPGLHSAVAAGMGVTALGASYLETGLRALEGWPELPQTTIMAVGEDGPTSELARPLIQFLAENMEKCGSTDVK